MFFYLVNRPTCFLKRDTIYEQITIFRKICNKSKWALLAAGAAGAGAAGFGDATLGDGIEGELAIKIWYKFSVKTANCHIFFGIVWINW